MIPKTDNAILHDRHSNSAGSTRMLLLNSQSCPNICSIGLLILALSCNVDRINEYSGIHQPFHLSIGVIYLPTLRNGFLASFLVACLSAPGQAQPCWKKIHHAETFYLLFYKKTIHIPCCTQFSSKKTKRQTLSNVKTSELGRSYWPFHFVLLFRQRDKLKMVMLGLHFVASHEGGSLLTNKDHVIMCVMMYLLIQNN